MPVDYSFTGVEDANNVLWDEFILEPSNLETIDFALHRFVDEKMDVRTETNKGWKKVPLIWASPERAYFSKEKKDLYDLDGTLIYPIMSIERTSIAKKPDKKGKYYGAAPFVLQDSHHHGGRIMIGRRIVQDKTNNFGVADNRKRFKQPKVGGDITTRNPGRQSYYPKIQKENNKVVVETLYIPQPVYISIDYSLTIKANYQQQINQMLQPFITLGGHINSFLIEHLGHSYEVFMNSEFTQTNNINSYNDEERNYQTQVNFNVLGYVIGEGDDQKRPKVIRRENAVEVKIPRERVVFGGSQQFDPRSDFYRE